MSYSISTLLTRNLHGVFGENDPARRRAAIDEVFTEDCVFYDPSKGVYRGRDEIDRVAGAIRATAQDSFTIPQSLGTTSAIRRSICSASSNTGLSRIFSAPACATSRRPCAQVSGGP